MFRLKNVYTILLFQLLILAASSVKSQGIMTKATNGIITATEDPPGLIYGSVTTTLKH